MIIAVIAVRVMEPSVHEIVNVVAVGDGVVATTRPMHVLRIMAFMSEFRCAAIGILGADLDDMFLDEVAFLVMEMAVVKIVNMIAVPDADMTAGGTVLVRMIGVDAVAVCGHGSSLAVFRC